MRRHYGRIRALIILSVVSAAMLVGAPGAHAALTSPANGAIVDGVIDLTEDTGATNTCSSTSAATEFEVLNSSGQLVQYFPDFRYWEGGVNGGPRTVAWDTDQHDWRGQRSYPNGQYTVRTRIVNSILVFVPDQWGGYYYCQQTQGTRSQVTITLRNYDFKFDDDNGAGRIAMNVTPVKNFRFEPTGGPKYFREGETSMTVYSLPDRVRPDLSCVDAGAATCVPAPPTEATACESTQTDCKPRLVRLVSDDAEWMISGLFDLKTLAFVAVAVDKATNEATVLSHAPPACATDPYGRRRCASDREEQCVPDPTTGEPVCVDPSGVPTGVPPLPPVPPVPPLPPVPPVPPAPCVFNPATGERVCPA